MPGNVHSCDGKSPLYSVAAFVLARRSPTSTPSLFSPPSRLLRGNWPAVSQALPHELLLKYCREFNHAHLNYIALRRGAAAYQM